MYVLYVLEIFTCFTLGNDVCPSHFIIINLTKEMTGKATSILALDKKCSIDDELRCWYTLGEIDHI